METLRYRLLNKLNVMRVIRLVMGLMIGAQAFAGRNLSLALLAALILLQSIFTAGCCVGGSCSVSHRN